MKILATYVHTNLVADDWRGLARFHQEVFGCVAVGRERDYRGETLEAGTGIAGAHLTGVHLRLPGYGEEGPTQSCSARGLLLNGRCAKAA